MNRRDLFAAAAATLGAVGLGDLLGTQEARAEPSPVRGGKFVYTNTYPNLHMGDAKTGRHPNFLLDINTRSVYNGLAYVNPQIEVEPELATSWESDADQKVWEIALREGVEFHDGRGTRRTRGRSGRSRRSAGTGSACTWTSPTASFPSFSGSTS